MTITGTGTLSPKTGLVPNVLDVAIRRRIGTGSYVS
jgi:hypothetical protein